MPGRGVLKLCYRHVQKMPECHTVTCLYYCPFEISTGLQFPYLAAVSAGKYSIDPFLPSKPQTNL
jgi:hypothetical protein